MNWAATHDASLDRLERVQGSLTIDLIMTPRSSFNTCSPSETAAQIKARNKHQFSYFPVVDHSDHVLGLYNAERWFSREAPDSPIAEDYDRLSEAIVIGADASIFDFVMQADTFPTNLVVSGNKIAGLVSLSDLQQLPVRAALFALITSLEMAMATRITQHWADQPDGWQDLLEDGPRRALERNLQKAKKEDNYVDAVILTQFSDKSRVVWEAGLLDGWQTAEFIILDKVRLLRNALAHGSQYAKTSTKAAEICYLVREIMEIKRTLSK